MPEEARSNGWTEYQKLVMTSLEQHEKKLESIYEAITDIKVEVGMLKVKAGIWGLAGGAIPAIITIVLLMLKKSAGLE